MPRSRYTFTGDTEQVYPQYLDAAAQSTLVAVPGETYEIAQVDGLTVPGEPDEDGNPTTVQLELAMPPDDRWKPKPARQQNTTDEGTDG